MERDLVFIYILVIAVFITYFSGISLANGTGEFLNGVITLDQINKDNQIKAMTFHFKDFPYDIYTECNLKNVLDDTSMPSPEITRNAYDENLGLDLYQSEEIIISDRYSWFISDIWSGIKVKRSEYINQLINRIDPLYDAYNKLAADKNTTAITFYPKTIDGRLCTIL